MIILLQRMNQSLRRSNRLSRKRKSLPLLHPSLPACFARLSRAEPFVRNNNDDIRKFEYRDGIIWDVTYNYRHSDSDNDKSFGYAAKRFNFNVKNDTNIDFWQLWSTRTSNETIVALTEWLSLRPDYLMDWKDGYFEYVYEYDTIGNLIKITYKSTDTNCIYKEVKIKYLY